MGPWDSKGSVPMHHWKFQGPLPRIPKGFKGVLRYLAIPRVPMDSSSAFLGIPRVPIDSYGPMVFLGFQWVGFSMFKKFMGFQTFPGGPRDF